MTSQVIMTRYLNDPDPPAAFATEEALRATVREYLTWGVQNHVNWNTADTIIGGPVSPANFARQGIPECPTMFWPYVFLEAAYPFTIRGGHPWFRQGRIPSIPRVCTRFTKLEMLNASYLYVDETGHFQAFWHEARLTTICEDQGDFAIFAGAIIDDDENNTVYMPPDEPGAIVVPSDRPQRFASL